MGVLRTGDGPDHPTADSPCECHYEGRSAANYPDGEKFDSSYDRGDPSTFAPNQVIKGWTEAMQMMVEGDKWELYIPSDLAYGDGGSPPKIPGGATLVFTIEILEINGEKVAALHCDPATGDGCNEKETKYIESRKDWEKPKIVAEVARLQNMKAKKMKPSLMAWVD